MKRLNILLSALILTSSLPVLADFCTNCGKSMPNDANFCPSCGSASNGAFQSAEPEQVTSSEASGEQTTIAQATAAAVDPNLAADNAALADYNFINKIEEYMAKATGNVAYSQCQELRRQNDAKLQNMNKNYLNFSIYRRKMHDLHIAKLDALDRYLEARKASERGSDVARFKAQMNKELFIIDKMNEAIDMLLTGGNTLVNLNKVEDIEKRVKKTTANYIVTSQYLTLGNVRVKRNEPIWIEDVSGASARVHHMGSSTGDEPASGYVSVYDLEKRSNWVADSAFFYSAPAGTTVVYTQPVRPQHVSVFVWDGVYPYSRWHHRPIFGPPPHGPHHGPHYGPHHGPAPAPKPRLRPGMYH